MGSCRCNRLCHVTQRTLDAVVAGITLHGQITWNLMVDLLLIRLTHTTQQPVLALHLLATPPLSPKRYLAPLLLGTHGLLMSAQASDAIVKTKTPLRITLYPMDLSQLLPMRRSGLHTQVECFRPTIALVPHLNSTMLFNLWVTTKMPQLHTGSFATAGTPHGV